MPDIAGRDDLRLWLRLTHVHGIGGESQRKLLREFGLPRHVFAAPRGEISRLLSPQAADRLLGSEPPQTVDAALDWAEIPGHRIVTLADSDYPQALLQIPDPPTLLYAHGRIELLNRRALAIVGSRNATAQGEANALAFASALSEAGWTIVSGLALGIDAAAHRGALKGQGSTIAVLGTGLDRVYPARNRDLAHAIAERGVLIGEFPLGTPATAANFPRRNRVIAGLAQGVLVVEAAPASGSLITARFAAEQGREVFAIPGSIHSPLSKGCHSLIKQGAKLVDNADDIVSELGGTASRQTAEPAQVPPAGGLLEHIGYDPCTIDALAHRSGLTVDALSAMLLELELEGRVASLPGGRYQRIR